MFRGANMSQKMDMEKREARQRLRKGLSGTDRMKYLSVLYVTNIM
jgi:hypothetical protein